MNVAALIALLLVGAALVSVGLYLIAPALAFIGLGSACVGVALVAQVRDR